MLINKEEAVLRIREQIARETPEHGASIEERLRIYHRRKAKEEALKAIEEIGQAIYQPEIYPLEPISEETALKMQDITELVKKYIEKAEEAIREEEETK